MQFILQRMLSRRAIAGDSGPPPENLIPYSEDFETWWTASPNLTTITDGQPGPSGQNNASTLTFTDAGTLQGQPLTGDSPVLFLVSVKNDAEVFVTLRESGPTPDKQSQFNIWPVDQFFTLTQVNVIHNEYNATPVFRMRADDPDWWTIGLYHDDSAATIEPSISLNSAADLTITEAQIVTGNTLLSMCDTYWSRLDISADYWTTALCGGSGGAQYAASTYEGSPTYVAKIVDGAKVWASTFAPSAFYCFIEGLALTNDEQYLYVAGFQIVSESYHVGEPFIAKLDAADGTLVWMVGLTTSYSDYFGIGNVVVDADDNVYALATFMAEDYSVELGLLKVTAAGALGWCKSTHLSGFGGSVVAAGGHVYVRADEHISKFNVNGTHDWSRTLSGVLGSATSYCHPKSGAFANGDLAIAGQLPGDTEAYVARIDKNTGAIVWQDCVEKTAEASEFRLWGALVDQATDDVFVFGTEFVTSWQLVNMRFSSSGTRLHAAKLGWRGSHVYHGYWYLANGSFYVGNGRCVIGGVSGGSTGAFHFQTMMDGSDINSGVYIWSYLDVLARFGAGATTISSVAASPTVDDISITVGSSDVVVTDDVAFPVSKQPWAINWPTYLATP